MSSANASAQPEGIGLYNRPGPLGMSTQVPFHPLPDPISDAQPANGVVPATNFAPPYQSRFLGMNPTLARQLTHVNCSYLTTHDAPAGVANTAPSLVELKRHAQGLMVLIREMTVASTSGLLDTVGLERDRAGAAGATEPAAPTFEMTRLGPVYRSTGAFDFINDLSTPYVSRDPADLLPLTHLLNQIETRLHPTEPRAHIADVCPLSAVTPLSHTADDPPAFRDGTNPLPHLQIERLMKHADEVLMLIDNALSASGGLLSALPLDLSADDLRRNSFLGQMIHFMRVLVGRVHVLDRDYGQAIDLLAGEATVPRELFLNLTNSRDLERVYDCHQHQFILKTREGTHAALWEHLRADASERAARDNGTGFLEVTLPTRFQAVRGGKTIFITPVVAEPPPSQAPGRPTVVACAKPGYGMNAGEWEKRHRGELEAAKEWKVRAEAAEAENARLRRDVEAMEPMGTWHDGENMKVLEMWARVAEREDALEERLGRVELYADRIKVLVRENAKLKREGRGRPAAAAEGPGGCGDEGGLAAREAGLRGREAALDERETQVGWREADAESKEAGLATAAAEAKRFGDDGAAQMAATRARQARLGPDRGAWTEAEVVDEVELLTRELDVAGLRQVVAESELAAARAEAAAARAEVARERAGTGMTPAPEEEGKRGVGVV